MIDMEAQASWGLEFQVKFIS